MIKRFFRRRPPRSNTVTCDKPSGICEGDLMVVHFQSRTDVRTTITPPEGWIRTGWSSWEKTATASEPDEYPFVVRP